MALQKKKLINKNDICFYTCTFARLSRFAMAASSSLFGPRSTLFIPRPLPLLSRLVPPRVLGPLLCLGLDLPTAAGSFRLGMGSGDEDRDLDCSLV